MNKVILMGRLTHSPELSQTESGSTYVRFSIAVNRRFKNAKGESITDFFNCIAWGKTAEFISKYFGKGNMISVAGEIQNDKWVDDNGNNRITTNIKVDEVYFTGSKNESMEKPHEEENSGAFEGDFSNSLQSASDDDLPF